MPQLQTFKFEGRLGADFVVFGNNQFEASIVLEGADTSEFYPAIHHLLSGLTNVRRLLLCGCGVQSVRPLEDRDFVHSLAVPFHRVKDLSFATCLEPSHAKETAVLLLSLPAVRRLFIRFDKAAVISLVSNCFFPTFVFNLISHGVLRDRQVTQGNEDAPIIPLLKTLNLNPSYFTTNSCSGRISILSQPPPDTTTTTTSKTKKKAKGGTWLFITHEPANPDSVIDLLFSDSSTSQSQHGGDLVFRFEPFIVAVEYKDISSAPSLVATAISCGFRESGITSVHKRVIIAIRLEVPLGSTNRIMVSPEYVRFLVKTANEKMELNRKRTDGFHQVLESKLLANEALTNGEEVHATNSSLGTEQKVDHHRTVISTTKLEAADGNSVGVDSDNH